MLCFKIKFQALVLCFVFIKLSSRLSVSMAYVCPSYRDEVKMEDNLIIHSKLTFGIPLLSLSLSSSVNKHSQVSIHRKPTLKVTYKKSLTVGSSRVTFSNFLLLLLSSSLFLPLSLPSSFSFCDNGEGLWSLQCLENLRRML